MTGTHAHRRSTHLCLWVLIILCAVAAGCGDDAGGTGADVAPGEVRFSDLTGGVWITDAETGAGQPEQMIQFLGADDARALYGGIGAVGVATSVLGTTTMDEVLSAFDDDDPIALVFPRGGGRLQAIYAVRVRNGEVGLSRLGEAAGNVEDGVLFSFGFSEPVHLPIGRLARRERLELEPAAAGHELVGAYRWYEDCRWTRPSGWTFTVTANYQIDALPWSVSAFTRAGDFVNYFHSEPGHLGSQVWPIGGCPIVSTHRLPLRTGHALVPWGERDVAVLYHDTDGLRGAVVDATTGPTLDALDPAVDGRITAWRAVDDTTLVVLEQVGRDGVGQWLPAQRTVLTDLTQRQSDPIPPIPDDAADVDVRLLADGRVTWTGLQATAPGEPRERVAGIETDDGAWATVDLVGDTDDGMTIDLRPESVGARVFVDVDGRVTALVPAREVVPAPHAGRLLGADADALVRLDGGRAEVHVVSGGTPAPFADGTSLRLGEGGLDADGTFVWFTRLEALEPDEQRLVVVRWPVGEVPSLQAVSRGVELSTLESGFFDNGVFKGTAIAAQREQVFGDDGHIIISDGWARTFVRPADDLARSETVDLTVSLVDPPAGARILSTRTPVFDCADTCTVTVDRGTLVDVQLDVPSGWVAVAPDGARCGDAELDAGYCLWVADASAEVAFAFRRSPAESVADTVGDAWPLAVVAGLDGITAAHLATGAGILPDGTTVEGATTAAPVEAVSRWTGTALDWVRPLEADLSMDGFALAADGDVLVVYALDTLGATWDDGTSGPIELRDEDRLLLRHDGETGELVEARALRVPDGLALTAHGLDAAGRWFAAGQTLRAIEDDPDTGLSSEAERWIVARWDVDGTASIVVSEPAERRAPPAARFAPLPGGGSLVLRAAAGDVVRRTVVDDDGQVVRDDDLRVASDGGAIPLDAIRLAPGDDELRVAFVTAGDASVGDASLPGNTPAVVVFGLDADGEPRDATRIELAEPPFEAVPRAVTRLADGRFMVVAARERFGQEALAIQGEAPVPIGPAFVRSGDIGGYETRALAPVSDGHVVWFARHYAGQVIRPWAMRPSTVVRLDPDRVGPDQDMFARE